MKTQQTQQTQFNTMKDFRIYDNSASLPNLPKETSLLTALNLIAILAMFLIFSTAKARANSTTYGMDGDTIIDGWGYWYATLYNESTDQNLTRRFSTLNDLKNNINGVNITGPVTASPYRHYDAVWTDGAGTWYASLTNKRDNTNIIRQYNNFDDLMSNSNYTQAYSTSSQYTHYSSVWISPVDGLWNAILHNRSTDHHIRRVFNSFAGLISNTDFTDVAGPVTTSFYVHHDAVWVDPFTNKWYASINVDYGAGNMYIREYNDYNGFLTNTNFTNARIINSAYTHYSAVWYVPEPSSAIMAIMGMGMLFLRRRCKA